MSTLAQVGMPGLPDVEGYQQVLTAVGLVAMLMLFFVNLAFALGVGADASRRVTSKQPLAFVGPGVWFLATWIGSFLVVALYWVLHYSSLRHPSEFPGRS